MLAKDLISDTIPHLCTSDTGVTALNWMEINRISHMPIVNNKDFLGLISDADIYDMNKPEEPIGNHTLSLNRAYIMHDQHIYEVIELISKLKLTVVPVLNEDNEYMGSISLNDLLQRFANLMAVQNPGGILVLELNSNDYSLSQIAQIVEGNDAKILSLYVDSPQDSTKLELTIKINRTDLSPILQTFERYNYTIKASFMNNEEVDDLINSRYELFMKYLNI